MIGIIYLRRIDRSTTTKVRACACEKRTVDIDQKQRIPLYIVCAASDAHAVLGEWWAYLLHF